MKLRYNVIQKLMDCCGYENDWHFFTIGDYNKLIFYKLIKPSKTTVINLNELEPTIKGRWIAFRYHKNLLTSS